MTEEETGPIDYSQVSERMKRLSMNEFPSGASVIRDRVEINKHFYEWNLEDSNKKDIEVIATERSHLKQIEEAGYIRFPVWTKNLAGEDRELEAWIHPDFEPSMTPGFEEKHGMKTNIYIPSYKRSEMEKSTWNMLKDFHADNWYLCIDPSQWESYAKIFPLEKLIIRDIRFRDYEFYDACSAVNAPITRRPHAGIYNFILEFARSMGEEYFFFMDDDIGGMALKNYLGGESGLETYAEKFGYRKEDFFRCSHLKEEYKFNLQKDYLAKLENLAIASRNSGFVGGEKFGISFAKSVVITHNTRVYCFYVNDTKSARHQIGRQNNDVISSIEQQKWGRVNLLSQAFSYNSMQTQADTGGSGGNTGMYNEFGTGDKGIVLVQAQPDISRVTFKYSRVHHTVNYAKYRGQRIVGAPILTK